jgi:hypothetical protein
MNYYPSDRSPAHAQSAFESVSKFLKVKISNIQVRILENANTLGDMLVSNDGNICTSNNPRRESSQN